MPPKTPSAQPPSQPTAEEKAPPKKAPPKKATGKKAPAAKATGEGKKKKRSTKVGPVPFHQSIPACEALPTVFYSRYFRLSPFPSLFFFRIMQHIESYKVYLYKVLKQVGLPGMTGSLPHAHSCTPFSGREGWLSA